MKVIYSLAIVVCLMSQASAAQCQTRSYTSTALAGWERLATTGYSVGFTPPWSNPLSQLPALYETSLWITPTGSVVRAQSPATPARTILPAPSSSSYAPADSIQSDLGQVYWVPTQATPPWEVVRQRCSPCSTFFWDDSAAELYMQLGGLSQPR